MNGNHLIRVALALALGLSACTKEERIPFEPRDFDQDGFSELVDCEDGDGTVYPGADELCDEVDNDCDGVVDDDATDATTWYLDADEDGFGDPWEPLAACTQPSGYVAVGTDCDDGDPAFYPGAVEDDCTDPSDYNCDGIVVFADEDGDGWAACEDCDDEEAAIHPGAVEVCDGEDNDCDEVADGPDAIDAQPFYLDYDQDGFGQADTVLWGCTAPEGYVADATDCDDEAEAVYPGAEEVCNGADDDCDGVDDDDPVAGTGFVVYRDLDGDGFGDDSTAMRSCDVPAGYSLAPGDCDDLEVRAYTGALEVCDGVDNDCNEVVDDEADDALSWYADVDGDGYGDSTDSVEACEQPSGYVGNDDDCDDVHDTAHPGRVEVCDEVDNDCDDEVDEDDAVDAPTWYHDSDRDGFGDAEDSQRSCTKPPRHVADDTDCDDEVKAVNPGANERCNDRDDDCDGAVDEDAINRDEWFLDADGDGQGGDYSLLWCDPPPDGYVASTGDCDDLDPAIYSGVDEVCDGVDNDCDDLVDDDDAVVGAPTWYRDTDGDGWGVEGTTTEACVPGRRYAAVFGDCAPDSEVTYPGADEVCDGVSNDCDDDIDEDAVGAPPAYVDLDGDGYGNPAHAITACPGVIPAGFVDNDDDCNDGQPAAYSGADEVCDLVDNDCDGWIDDDDFGLVWALAPTWYADDDGDGFGDAGDTWQACEVPTGYSAYDTDCDDSDAAMHPAALERCNGEDDDCDGSDDEDAVDERTWYFDYDGDTFGDPETSVESCERPTYYVADATDCDDDDITEHPGAGEDCDGEDNDCDGLVDEGALGESSTCAASSCADILALGGMPPSGVYWIDPVGGAPYEVYCDMYTQGGGWTLLAVFTNGGSAVWQPGDPSWIDTGTFGSPTQPVINADAKSQAFIDLPVDEVMVLHWPDSIGVVSSTGCIGANTMRFIYRRHAGTGTNCAWHCSTVAVAGDWTGSVRQDTTLRFRCTDTNGGRLYDSGNFLYSADDNSFLTTMSNSTSYHDYNFGLGAGNSGGVDWDRTTDDDNDASDNTQVLLFGR